MAKTKENKKGNRKASINQNAGSEQVIAQQDMEHLEFHRHALALLPEPGDTRPGVAYFVKGHEHKPEWQFCSCNVSKRRTCAHTLRLTEIYKTLQKNLKGRSLAEDFKSSIWYRLARIMGEGSRITAESIHIQSVDARFERYAPHSKSDTDGSGRYMKISSRDGEEMISYFSQGPDASRLIERLAKISDEDTVSHRAAVLERLALLTLNENERVMLDNGFKTRGLALEESFWYRIAYHGYRELGPSGCTLHPAIEEASGSFTVTCRRTGGEPVFRMMIPRNLVRSLLATFQKLLPNQHNMAIHPIPLKSLFKITMNTEMDLNVRPLIQLIQENGEEKFFDREDLERFRYGDLVYLKELGIMAELERPGKQRMFKAPIKMSLKKSQIPTFLEEFGDDLREGPYILDEKVKALRIFKHVDRLQILPEAIDRDWCWLDVKYGFGNTFISLAEILSARKQGQRFVGTPEGWVDCQSGELDSIAGAFSEMQLANRSNRIRLSRMDLFRIRATSTRTLEIDGDAERVGLLNRILALRPATGLPPLKGMLSPLRPYQRLGTEWIMFLFENGFGGLLCDDMGLGKTHQAMAFMLTLKELQKLKNPCLVVCPTTVLSHWKNKISQHVPGLKATEYYGGQRDLDDALGDDVLLTSYGILRRDIEQLKCHDFSLVFFDEIQHIKNPQTQTYQAARAIKAGMKIGLTGTPIENSLTDLKALLDLTIPGYLGPDDQFNTRYVQKDNFDSGSARRDELVRLVSPFTLRRLKKTVLKELPVKIEDIRTCMLSEDQVKLYRDAISSRGSGLLGVLRKGEEPIPYMHIFAVLTLLKQICNHPSLVQGAVEAYDHYQSGKWELFKELLEETLDSGQKVVVYSQFLGMIEIMERYLQEQHVGFVTLTGATRKRGEIIAQFNNDPDCRVYVGSLKAGGTGIDLVGASVVIHYDRWWNAAREDQATDRVHRIGQKRGVHVFKLVTEGTLEEKISAIIEKKGKLMESVIKEDDPGLLKSFSREDLIDLLSIPVQHEMRDMVYDIE
jgi:superfamily II DNA or RNA helicase